MSIESVNLTEHPPLYDVQKNNLRTIKGKNLFGQYCISIDLENIYKSKAKLDEKKCTVKWKLPTFAPGFKSYLKQSPFPFNIGFKKLKKNI